MSLGQIAALTLTSLVIIAIPGPSVLFVVGRALAHGRGTALASVAGNAAGCLLAALVVAMGLGPLLQRSDALLEAVKLAGALYLVWLGVQAWRGADRHSAPAAPEGGAAQPAPQLWRAARSGVVVGVSNPKVFVLFAAILPQFVTSSSGPVAAQLVVLSLVPIAVGLVCDSSWALLAARVRGSFTRRPDRLRSIGKVGGASMIGLGLLTATTGNHA